LAGVLATSLFKYLSKLKTTATKNKKAAKTEIDIQV